MPQVFGSELVRTKGSHNAYRRPGAPPITVARRQPHVHSEAVKDVLRAILEVSLEAPYHAAGGEPTG